MARDATMKSAWLYLCVVCASLLLLGCSNQNDADKSEPATAVESQNLTSPVVITLSSPSPLSPIAPVLLGANGATVNSSANVVAGTVVAMGTSGFSAGVSADANDVWSRGTAHLATNVDIRGTLHAVSSSTSLGDRITGTDTTPAFDPPQTLSWTVTYPTGTANNVSVPQNQTQSLAPGLYGTVSVGFERHAPALDRHLLPHRLLRRRAGARQHHERPRHRLREHDDLARRHLRLAHGRRGERHVARFS